MATISASETSNPAAIYAPPHSHFAFFEAPTTAPRGAAFDALRGNLRLDDLRISDSGDRFSGTLWLMLQLLLLLLPPPLLSASSACTDDDSSLLETRNNGDDLLLTAG